MLQANIRIHPALATFLVLLLSLSGCTLFTAPREKPIIENNLSAEKNDAVMATLAVDASRRIVMTNLIKNTSCAEPPPDIAESVARSFALALNSAVERGDLDAEAAARAATEYQTAIKQLSPLSQGVKFARDSLFSLCQARSNYFLTNADFYWLFLDILQRSSILIAEEIPLLKQGFDAAQAKALTDDTIEKLRELEIRDPAVEGDDESGSKSN